jgi:hypothetical protein
MRSLNYSNRRRFYMINDCYIPKPYLATSISHDLIISAISNELEVLKLKLKYISKNPDFIDDTNQLSHHLNELMSHLNVLNRGLPPLPSEIDLFDRDDREEN